MINELRCRLWNIHTKKVIDKMIYSFECLDVCWLNAKLRWTKWTKRRLVFAIVLNMTGNHTTTLKSLIHVIVLAIDNHLLECRTHQIIRIRCVKRYDNRSIHTTNDIDLLGESDFSLCRLILFYWFANRPNWKVNFSIIKNYRICGIVQVMRFIFLDCVMCTI